MFDVLRRADVWLPMVALLGTAVVATPTASAAGTNLVITPSTASVNPGDSFQVDVVLSTDTPTRGVQFGLTYDASLVQIDKAEAGPFYTNWSDANGGKGAAVMPFQPHNETGQLATGAIALLGGPVDGPTGSGTVLTLQMKAKPGASGRSPLLMTDVVVSNPQAQSVLDATWTGAVVGVGLGAEAVGPPPEPVLAAQDMPVTPPHAAAASPSGVLGVIMGLPPINWFVAGLVAGCAGSTAGFVLLGWLRVRPAPRRLDAKKYALER